MKAETAGYLARAHEDLGEARQIFRISLAKVAARSAYYAAFHAAEAYILEKSGKVVKTHKGVRTEFARLMRSGPDQRRSMTTFLAQAYRYKELSDYSTDPSEVVSLDDAEAVIASAAEFLQWVENSLT